MKLFITLFLLFVPGIALISILYSILFDKQDREELIGNLLNIGNLIGLAIMIALFYTGIRCLLDILGILSL